jgi:fructose-1,6-bisphosphatase/inositol monophosphatase family enzyme
VDGERVRDDLQAVATAIAAELGDLQDWGLAGTRPGQYRSDLAADAVAVARLRAAGFGVLSEETGLHDADREVVVVVDPLDGSTNASRGIPWYATSLCAVDGDGPLAAVVVNLVSGTRYDAVRGGGARMDGAPLHPSGQRELGGALIGLSGYPARYLGWRQFRALGAAALDLCAVAAGVLDGYLDCSHDAHGSWDYLGGLLVCREAGAVVADADGRELVALEHDARRTPVAAGTPELLDALLAARATLPAP